MTEKVLTALFLAMIASTVWWTVANARLLGYLRKNHRPLWDALGQPAWLWNRSFRNSWLTTQFYMTRAYNKIGDPIAAGLGRQAFVVFILCWVLFVSFFFAGVFLRPLLGS